MPICRTPSYQFESAEHAALPFSLQQPGHVYTRITNATNDVLEKRVAAVALACRQAAPAVSVQSLARQGDNIVSSTDLYGGTWNLFANTLRDQGIETRFVSLEDPGAFLHASDDRTRSCAASRSARWQPSAVRSASR